MKQSINEKINSLKNRSESKTIKTCYLRLLTKFAIGIVMITSLYMNANAQGFYQYEDYARPGNSLSVDYDNKTPANIPAEPTQWRAHWILEAGPDSKYYFIKNRYKPELYLYATDDNQLKLDKVNKAYNRFMWVIEEPASGYKEKIAVLNWRNLYTKAYIKNGTLTKDKKEATEWIRYFFQGFKSPSEGSYTTEITVSGNQVTPSPARFTENGEPFVEYTTTNIPDKELNPATAIVNMKFVPKVAIKDKRLYVHLSTLDSSINIKSAQLSNSNTSRGYFVDNVTTTIEVDDKNFEKKSWGPKNVNNQGSITDMESLSVGASKDGPTASYTLGTSTTQTFNDFELTDNTYANKVEGNWKMGVDLIEKSVGQYSSLKEPPALARSNFPIYQQAIFISKTPGYLPDEVTLKVTVQTSLRKLVLVPIRNNKVEAFLDGFFAYANPNFYQGNLMYTLQESIKASKFTYKITLDLRELKKQNTAQVTR